MVRILGIPRHAKELQRRCGLARLPYAEITTVHDVGRIEKGGVGHVRADRVGGVRKQSAVDGRGSHVGFEVYSSDLHRSLFVDLGHENQVDEGRISAVLNSTYSHFYLECVFAHPDGNLER